MQVQPDHYKFFGTMLIVLRQMLLDAMLFIALSFIFYVGFLQAFFVLHDNTKSYGEIAWLLLQVFFGSAFLGFEQAQEISKLFGAPLMVLFVAISVLMLYTLLISIFSQTFSEVSANAKEEFMFLFSVKVMEEVKSDALYEFQPPFNILAGIFIWPCRLLYPPKVVGKLSRVLLRFFYFPELVCIWLFEILVLSKKPPYVPVRPGHVEHHGTYNSTSSVPEYEDGSVGDGVAGQRQEERSNNGAMKNSILGSFPEVAPSPAEPQRLSEEPHQMGATHTPDPSFKTQRHQRQQPDRLNTNDLSSSAQEVLSPYFESIRKFRNVNRNNSSVVTAPSTRNDSEGGSEHPQYSYYASAPIGLGAARQGSISGYRRSRRGTGTEATLANTYQGVSSSYHNAATGGDLSSLIGDSFVGDHYSHHQFHDQYPQQQQQQQHEDIEELALLMETRQAEMRIRMDQIESKLDQLLLVLTNNNQNGK
ncbi:hypothetical protein BGX21_009456 [Mortierella sp. AD011]|nr:hypothetical protein BGX20_005522 [Mortierella sp. AD010]KAF9396683.1 hypothetical protein BGX21_009456 [Mortierella sp. AD011]